MSNENSSSDENSEEAHKPSDYNSSDCYSNENFKSASVFFEDNGTNTTRKEKNHFKAFFFNAKSLISQAMKLAS